MFTFIAVTPRLTYGLDIEWYGFNSAGTLVYGLWYEPYSTRMHVFCASVFGGVQKIADFELAPKVCCVTPIFYTKRQQFVWTRPGKDERVCFVTFNVETGQIKRYRDVGELPSLVSFDLVRAFDDVLILWAESHDGNIFFYEIVLNPMDETFSVKILVVHCFIDDAHNLRLLGTMNFPFFYQDRLFRLISSRIDVLLCYEIESQCWFTNQLILHEFDKPRDDLENALSRRPFDGRCLLFLNHDQAEIQLYSLDVCDLMWKKVFTDHCVNDESHRWVKWVASASCQTACSFRQDSHDEGFVTIQITVHNNCRQIQPLNYQCIRALRAQIRRCHPRLSDTHVYKQLLLLLKPVVNTRKYFGRKFN